MDYTLENTNLIMLKKHIMLLSAIVLLAASCGSSSNTPAEPEVVVEVNHFDTLKTWMTGSFSSALQAQNDSDYYDISLEMHPIWTQAEKEAWLYVEQSLASMKDKPYRQRVYHVFQENDSSFVSEVYEMSTP